MSSRTVVVLDIGRELGGYEDVAALKSAVTERTCNARLVAVGICCVNVAVARLERRKAGGVALLSVCYLPSAKADGRYFDAVIQREVIVLYHICSFVIRRFFFIYRYIIARFVHGVKALLYLCAHILERESCDVGGATP